MANDKSTAVSSLSDTHARDQFICVALREIIAGQIAEGKWNHEMAAAHAVRYANAVMPERAKAPVSVVVSQGVKTPAKTELGPADFKVLASSGPSPDHEGDQPTPKTIAEIIGDAEPVAEVK